MEVVINKENFESEVLKSDKPVLVDFWATWCGPCAMLAPTIKEIADENPDIKVCKADVDENMELAQQFKISVVPTLLAFKDGKVVNTLVGAESKEQILAMLK
ncbi:MAG: thioredoxin [Lachnospiraceae bacterium]|nr:thioredoxin [Lachnospiraceae bacterium]